MIGVLGGFARESGVLPGRIGKGIYYSWGFSEDGTELPPACLPFGDMVMW